MIVDRKQNLLTLNAFLQLRMAHAAVVTSYECHTQKNAMEVNRLLLVFRDDGSGDCVIRNPAGEQELTMRAGHLYFIPCNVVVGLDITPGISFVSLQFNLDLFYGFDVFGSSSRCEMLEDAALVATATRLLVDVNELRALCGVNELIFHLCTRWIPAGTADLQQNVVAYHTYEDILAFIRREGDATTTVGMLADMHGMRSDVFSRTFTRDMGITPKAFLAKVLMRKASKMLLNPGTTVRQVAEGLSFSSAYYFSRFFKERTGMPPSVYRKQG